MRVFELKVDDEALSPTSDMRARHVWGLPGTQCDTCNATWSNTGLAYPSVDLSLLPSPDRYKVVWPVALAEFEQLLRPIAELMPAGSVLGPGTDFGPLTGTAKGTFGHFAWLNSWTLLVRQEAYELLPREGVQMPKGVPASLRFRGSLPPVLVELEIEPLARISRRSLPDLDINRCQACGRNPFKVPDHIEVELSSIPEHVDLFRLREFTTIILGRERFVETARALRLSGISFEEVTTV
jgi:uncharacterized double-CXXCG motif protein